LTQSYFVNLQTITLSELRMARKNVLIAVAWINFDEYYNAFYELLSHGVHIEIIINDDRNNARYNQQIKKLTDLGAIIHKVNAGGTMHHKFCVIDEKRCLFGSYNWTINAECRNIEDLNICDEPQVVYSYLKEFVAIRKLSKTDLRLLRNPVICPCCGNPKMNILVIEPEGYYQTKIQMVEYCDCGFHEHEPEYYEISVYENYHGLIEKYERDLKDCDNAWEQEEVYARMDFEIAMYWSYVRSCRFGFLIVHAVAEPGFEIYGRHDDEPVYHIIWKERGMENYIPDRISRNI